MPYSRHIALLCHALILLGALAALGTALFMQHVHGQQPCTLCIIQRYAFLLVGLCALISMVLPFRGIRIMTTLLGLLGAFGGIVAATRNLWVMAHPEILCGRDPVELFLNGLPSAHWFPQVFVASGLCSAPLPPLFGLAFPAWSLLGLLVIAGLFGFSLRQR